MALLRALVQYQSVVFTISIALVYEMTLLRALLPYHSVVFIISIVLVYEMARPSTP